MGAGASSGSGPPPQGQGKRPKARGMVVTSSVPGTGIISGSGHLLTGDKEINKGGTGGGAVKKRSNSRSNTRPNGQLNKNRSVFKTLV